MAGANAESYEGQAGTDQHTHRFRETVRTHTHPGGARPHEYYAHTGSGDGPPVPAGDDQDPMTGRIEKDIHFQDSREFPGGSTLVTTRGHGQSHTEFSLPDLRELRDRVIERITELTQDGEG
jgi:hypothetical protein